MSWFTLYLLTVIPEIKTAATVALVLTCIGCAAAFIGFGISHDTWGEPSEDVLAFRAFCKRLIRNLAVAIVCLAVPTVALPDQKSLMFIVGGSTLIEATKTDTAQRLAGKSLQAVEAWLDEQIAAEKQ